MAEKGGCVLSVDFAPRHSAAALLSQSGVLLEHSTLDAGPESLGFLSHAGSVEEWVCHLKEAISRNGFELSETTVVVEDVTHMMTKPAQVLRLQGALRVFLRQQGFPEPVMVLPAVWQKFFGWQKTPGTTSKGFAKFACLVLGYEILSTSGKQTVDVRDAVLIGRWLLETRSSTI